MKFNFDNPLAIALIPFLGYTVAFFYEVGYLTAFGIPIQFVQVRNESLVFFSISAAFMFIVGYGLMDILIHAYQSIQSRLFITKPLKITFFFYTVVIFFIIYIRNPKYYLYLPILLALFVLTVFMYFIFPLWEHRKSDLSYADKLRLSNEKKIKGDKQKNRSFLDNEKLNNFYLFLIVLFLVSGLAQSLGEKEGIEQKKFVVFSYNYQEFAYIRDYKDEKIVARIVKNELTDSYLLIRPQESIRFEEKVISRRK